MAQILMPNAAQVNAPQNAYNLDASNLQHRIISDLSNHYLEKHKQVNAPWQVLLDGIAIILSVAIAILSNLAGFSALALGIGAMVFISGLGRFALRQFTKLNVNAEASHAILSPSFYEFARQQPRNLASAEAIVRTHRVFMG